MTTTTEPTDRQKHLDWCKQRALEYVGGDNHAAVASMLSDLGKHEGTAGSVALGVTLMLAVNMHSDHDVRRFIEGFN